MAVVVLSPCNVANFPEGGGHFWVYMQYAQGLRRLGCDVYWLERFDRSADADLDARRLSTFFKRMARYGLGGKAVLYTSRGQPPDDRNPDEYLGLPRSEAEAVWRRTDLLLNFHYAVAPDLLSCFRRTALVDIDPGLLQFWMSAGQLRVPHHDLHFTIGETVGTLAALFPACGRTWLPIRPPVCLEFWPLVHDPGCDAFTTVSSWWGAGKAGEESWVTDGKDVCYDNNKRIAFLAFLDLPRRTTQALELALFLNDDPLDNNDRQLLGSHGWRVRHSREVAGTPDAYRSYLQGSRGEFSCAKPSCLRFQNAWVSDRTLCYLASGKPAVVQDTGPSSFLPNGEGLFRFSTAQQAADALSTINADYGRHCRAAREIAEAYFDAEQVCERILNVALHSASGGVLSQSFQKGRIPEGNEGLESMAHTRLTG
jgi:hypothetical protein